jgi:hypothetical protein
LTGNAGLVPPEGARALQLLIENERRFSISAADSFGME